MREGYVISSEYIVLIDALGKDVFFPKLVEYINKKLAIQSCSAILYSGNKPPKLLFSDLLKHEESIFYARFLDGAYVASPAYQGFVKNYSNGLYTWSELMPQGFKESQMFAAYYQPSGIEDLVYFFINSKELGFIQFCIGRHAPFEKFNKNELNLLQPLIDFLLSIIRKHCDILINNLSGDLHRLSSIVSDRVSYLLDNFEPELLTSRERDIAKLVITGHSSQSAADILCISPGTERVHRAKLYAKLKLRSNSELFSLFLEKLTEL